MAKFSPERKRFIKKLFSPNFFFCIVVIDLGLDTWWINLVIYV